MIMYVKLWNLAFVVFLIPVANGITVATEALHVVQFYWNFQEM